MHQLQRMGLILTAVDHQAEAGAIEEAARGVEEGRAHRGVEGIDLPAQVDNDGQRCLSSWRTASGLPPWKA